MPNQYIIQWRDQFFRWHQYQVQHGYTSAHRTAHHRAQVTGKQHRIVDGKGNLMDLIHP